MTIDEKAANCMAGFPMRMAEAMAARELKRSDLARELNCCWGTVGTWAKGAKAPGCYNLIRLAEVLCVTTDWLLGVSEQGGPIEKGEAA